MKNLWTSWMKINLVIRIAIGLLFGGIVGYLASVTFGTEVAMSGAGAAVILIGQLFKQALVSLAPILVFFLVISALANAKTKGTMPSIVVLYLISTFLAAILAVIASYLFPIELVFSDNITSDNTPPSGLAEVLTDMLTHLVANPVEALSTANYLGILTWAVLLGIALRKAKDSAKDIFHSIGEGINTITQWVINLAPFGVFGITYQTIVAEGLQAFVTYGQLILVLVGCMLVMALIVNPLIVWLNIRKNPYPLVLRCLVESGLNAFATRSSAANIPVNMELCRKLRLNEDDYSVSIPLGATINMAGAAITITIMTMMACHTFGIVVDPLTAIILSIVAALSACGASGVAGGSLLLIPLACSLFGIDNAAAQQIIGIGLVIGIIQDSCETALNSSSDVLLTATAEYRAKRLAGEKIDYREWL